MQCLRSMFAFIEYRETYRDIVSHLLQLLVEVRMTESSLSKQTMAYLSQVVDVFILVAGNQLVTQKLKLIAEIHSLDMCDQYISDFTFVSVANVR